MPTEPKTVNPMSMSLPPDTNSDDEPLTPAGRMFLQPQMNQIIHAAFGLKNPVNVTALKSEIHNSEITKHPRFHSLMIHDSNGVEHWRKTQLNLDDHILVINDPLTAGEDSESAVNNYLADLAVSTPLSADKPLWEIHVLTVHKCLVLRIHHAIGDGISLMSLFLACGQRIDGNESIAGAPGRRKELERQKWTVAAVEFVKMVWFSLVFIVQFGLRALWVGDRRTPVSGGDGVELWARKVATARFLMDDMKVVKRFIDNGTINDVIFGVISQGLSRYLDHRSAVLKDGLQITGVAMVNLRKHPGLQDVSKLTIQNSGTRWGNQFGMMLLPVYYHRDGHDPLQYLKRAKVMLDRKKMSVEAHFSYLMGDLLTSWFRPKFAALLNYKIVCRTSFTFSNVVGPQEEIMFAGNPVTYIRVTSCSLPHALTMHLVSYAGWADMQILVAKDIIPDPEFLAKCFEDALFEMKQAAGKM